MNSADVFSLEFDTLARTSALADTLDWFRGHALDASAHRQLLLELSYVTNVHTRLREIAEVQVPAEDWACWQELLAVPTLSFAQGRAFMDDVRTLGLTSFDRVSLTQLPQTTALAAYAHYQLVERAAVGLIGYLWFFERMPRLLYPLWSDSGQRGGVSARALRAVGDGARYDTARDNLVAQICRQLVRRPRDLGHAIQSLDDTAVLFATLVEAAVDRAERRTVPAVEPDSPGMEPVALNC